MITNRSMIVAVLMLAMCVLVWAQSPASRNNEEPASGAITGRVVNENGQALAGASLNVRAVNSSNPGRNTTADIEGNFRVNGLDPGLYTVSANAPAYTSEPTPGTYYRVGDSVRLQLIKGGVVTGTVTNAMGEPVVGVSIRVQRIRDAQGQLPKVPLFHSQQSTDDRGMYRVYGLAPGTYIVSAGGGSGFIGFFNPFDSDIPTFSPASTRDTAAEIVVRAGEESTADIRYRGEPGYSISGKVNVSGNDRATVTLTPVGPLVATSNAFVGPGSTGFMFNGLPDGEYKLVASVLSSTPSSALPLTSLSEVKRVTIKRASVTGIELTPKPLGSISGRISLEPTKVAECQGKRPPLFVETLIQAHRNEKDVEDDDPFYQRTLSSTGTPDGNGAFVLRNVRPGRYRFEPRFYARYWYLQSIAMSAGTPKPQKIDMAASWTAVKFGEQLNNVTITLAEGAASLRGRIAVAEGATAPTVALVYLVPTEPDKVDDVLHYFVTTIEADGTFTLSNLPPGKYLALTQTNADAQIETLAKLRQPESAAARTKLRRSAEAQKAEIELKPCQNLTNYQLSLK